MDEKYQDVKDLIKKIDSSSEFKHKSVSYIKDYSLSKFLSLIRCQFNLTQKQLASKIKCSQSRISKIESSANNQIAIKDLTDYGNALNKRLVINYEDKTSKSIEKQIIIENRINCLRYLM